MLPFFSKASYIRLFLWKYADYVSQVINILSSRKGKYMTGKKASMQHVSRPMPLDTFLLQAKMHCQTLESKDAALLHAYRIFASSTDISFEQYRRISSLMQQVGETVEELCLLLSDAESLPQSARSYRYLPLVTFQYIHGQIEAILSALASMRQLRKTPSPQKNRLKLLVHNKLRSLGQDLHEGQRHIRNLTDQALLEEKRVSRLPSRQQQKLFVIPGTLLRKEKRQKSFNRLGLKENVE